jgi:DNA-directed RNA polymerase specialized sigma24 family protein
LRGLTPEDFEALLARLAPDREQAGVLYVNLRHRLVRLFAWCHDGDADSLADEAIDRVARQLAEGKKIHTTRPFGYFRSVARHVAQEMRRKRQAFYAQATFLPHAEPEPDVDRRFARLQDCLDPLPSDQRRLILRYYGEGDRISDRQRLAHELGIASNALRIRVHRARRKLEACCSRCLAAEFPAPRPEGAAPAGERMAAKRPARPRRQPLR